MAFSLLGLVNALVPKDRKSRRIAADIAFGSDPRHKLDIYSPTQWVGKLPVVFFIYGGSWMDGERGSYEFAGRALAALGYVVVIADYRVVPQVEYPLFIEDGAAALQWVADNIDDYGGDAQRVAIMGHSAGAYNAVMLALDPRYLAARELMGRIRCVVGLSGPYDFFPFDGPISLRTFGAIREPKLTQPVNLVTPTSPPMLLGTGEKDTLVYPRNSVALAARLREAGVAVEEIHYAYAGHPATLLALMRPLRHHLPVLADVSAYLARHLGDDVSAGEQAVLVNA
jgi:acetyl esterase/lipase